MSSDNDRPLYTRRRVIGLGAAALGATAAGRVIPAYGAQGSTIDSYNWSGARVAKDVLPLLYPTPPNPPNQFFTSVKATWRVPKVQLHLNDAELRSATWIGLDGGTWGLPDTPTKVKVLQAGTYHEVPPGSTVGNYFAFFGLDEGDPSETDLYPKLKKQSFVVKPSDVITVVLEYIPGSPNTANATFTSASQSMKYQISSIPDGSITGYTVEWVFERISLNNDSSKTDYRKSYHSLGNHDALVFSNAEAMTNQGNTVSPDDGDSINMRDVDDWPALLTGGTALSGEVQIKRR